MILLTDEEIQETFDTFLDKHPGCQWDSIMMCRAQNKAQLKKVEDMGLLRHDSDAYGRCKPECRACEALLEEVKE